MRSGIAMIGFMGAGKSTVAAAVADALGLPLVDTDAIIEKAHGSIAEIFSREGETRFRTIECEVACAALDDCLRRPAVVALGGGAVTSADVREALSRQVHVVWVDAPVGVLFERASASGTRPLARDRTAFEALYAERRPLYAHLATATVVAGEDETAAGVARRVVDLVGHPARATEAGR